MSTQLPATVDVASSTVLVRMDDRHDQACEDLGKILQDLHEYWVRLEKEGDGSDVGNRIRQAMQRLREEFFLLVVMGEYSVGKTTLITTLLSDRVDGQAMWERVLRRGPTPTTDQVVEIVYGEQEMKEDRGAARALVRVPSSVLAGARMKCIDTPGTNFSEEHERITREYLPRADFVIFVMSAVNPVKLSEKRLLHEVVQMGKKIIVVITHIDARTHDQVEALRRFVADEMRRAGVSEEPRIFTVSLHPDARDREDNQLADLKKWLADYVRSVDVARTKLETPLQLADGVAKDLVAITEKILDGLEKDAKSFERARAEIREFERGLMNAKDAFLHRSMNYFKKAANDAIDNLPDDVIRRKASIPLGVNEDALRRHMEKSFGTCQDHVIMEWRNLWRDTGYEYRSLVERVGRMVENMEFWKHQFDDQDRYAEMRAKIQEEIKRQLEEAPESADAVVDKTKDIFRDGVIVPTIGGAAASAAAMYLGQVIAIWTPGAVTAVVALTVALILKQTCASKIAKIMKKRYGKKFQRQLEEEITKKINDSCEHFIDTFLEQKEKLGKILDDISGEHHSKTERTKKMREALDELQGRIRGVQEEIAQWS